MVAHCLLHCLYLVDWMLPHLHLHQLLQLHCLLCLLQLLQLILRLVHLLLAKISSNRARLQNYLGPSDTLSDAHQQVWYPKEGFAMELWNSKNMQVS